MVRLYETGNAASLAEAVLYLYRHPEAREAMPRVAAEKFLSRFTWRTHQAVYVDLVEGLLQGK